MAIRLFSQVMRLPQAVLAPIILSMTFVGIYALDSSLFNAWLMFGMGMFGYVLNRLHFPLAPIVLGLILGDLAEQNLRLTLLINQGNWGSLFYSPLSIFLALLSLLVMTLPFLGRLSKSLRDNRKP